jgi:glycosyltransferase involved in cell wall biosynthesis
MRDMFAEINIPAAIQTPPLTGEWHLPGGGADRLSYGWNVVGYFSAELGVGEAGRLMNLAAEAGGVATNLVTVGAAASRHEHPLARPSSETLLYENSLYCVNADELFRTMSLVGDAWTGPGPRHGGGGGRRIGLWFWEVDTFPREWAPLADYLDEIWTASDYAASAISSACSRPVEVVPLPICPPTHPTPYQRRHLDLPDGFVFLFSYDFNSLVERKNPLGLIDAYTRAFGPQDGANLVLKSINGTAQPGLLDRIRYAARGRADIIVMDRYLDSAQVQALIELTDCFVSLHRSEGFGLHLAAAMALGQPVIATGYSGNMTFMDETTALLVPFDLVPVGPGCDPYPPEAYWAEPDLDAAASLMHRVFSGDADVAAVAAAGARRMANQFGLAGAGRSVGSRLISEWPAARLGTDGRVNPVAEAIA